MSGIYRERVESVTHSDYVGVRCDGCGREHLRDKPADSHLNASVLIQVPAEWIWLMGRAGSFERADLCGDCGARMREFLKTLRPA